MYDKTKIHSSTVEIVLQVNGKIRGKVNVAVDTSEEELRTLAFADENVRIHIDGKKVAREIIVKNKLVNLVAR